jgi:hypothetical protein
LWQKYSRVPKILLTLIFINFDMQRSSKYRTFQFRQENLWVSKDFQIYKRKCEYKFEHHIHTPIKRRASYKILHLIYQLYNREFVHNFPTKLGRNEPVLFCCLNCNVILVSVVKKVRSVIIRQAVGTKDVGLSSFH